jgi:hypothetical protein
LGGGLTYVGFLFDGVNATTPLPLETLARQKHCYYHETYPGEGLLAERILLYPPTYKKRALQNALAASVAARNNAMKTV